MTSYYEDRPPESRPGVKQAVGQVISNNKFRPRPKKPKTAKAKVMARAARKSYAVCKAQTADIQRLEGELDAVQECLEEKRKKEVEMQEQLTQLRDEKWQQEQLHWETDVQNHGFWYEVKKFTTVTTKVEFLRKYDSYVNDVRNDFSANSECKHPDPLISVFRVTIKQKTRGITIPLKDEHEDITVCLEWAFQVLNLVNVNFTQTNQEIKERLGIAIARIVSVNTDRQWQLRIQRDTLAYCMHYVTMLKCKDGVREGNFRLARRFLPCVNMDTGRMNVGYQHLTLETQSLNCADLIFQKIKNAVQSVSRWAVTYPISQIRKQIQTTLEQCSMESANEWLQTHYQEIKLQLQRLKDSLINGLNHICPRTLNDSNLMTGLNQRHMREVERRNYNLFTTEFVNLATRSMSALNYSSRMSPTGNSNMPEESMPEQTSLKSFLVRGLKRLKMSCISLAHLSNMSRSRIALTIFTIGCIAMAAYIWPLTILALSQILIGLLIKYVMGLCFAAVLGTLVTRLNSIIS